MSVIEEVKQRTDIIEVVGQFTKLTKAGRTFRGLCPFHSEKTPSFFVYPEQQSWHCFGACNTGGDVFSFIMKKQGVEFGEALRYLAERAGVTVPVYGEREGEKEEKNRLYQVNQAAAEYYHQLLVKSQIAKAARDYLTGRGLTLETLVKFQLGYAPNEWEDLKRNLLDKGYTEKELLQAGLIIQGEAGKTHDRFRNKIMFSICDIKGRVIGFGARVMDDSLPKYINSPQTPLFDKSGSLYGINLAVEAIKKENLAVFVEGYMDVIIPHQYGFNNVVASMGTSLTERQMNQLKRLTHNISFALDSDSAGQLAGLKGIEYREDLNADPNTEYSSSFFTKEINIILLPPGKDPDEVVKENPASWKELVNSSIPVIESYIRMTTAGLDLKKVEDKTALIDKVLPLLTKMKNDTKRDHYLTELSTLTGIKYNTLEFTLHELEVAQNKLKSKDVKTKADKITRSSLTSPVEEYLLSLLLQHPEIKELAAGLQAEYFENSENREIFLAWQKTAELGLLKEQLDNSIQEHLQLLLGKKIPATQIERKYADCSLRLQEEYLRHLERKKSQVLALERETGGTDAELAKQKEQGNDVPANLKEVFTQRGLHQKR